ncbi:serine hydrolase domain-containing protein [Actinoalloteichus hymeniacidonis]|uniref:Penicillin-binding protein, beta-lactamase class C n=1 Tax=Actinoalloteichus hymeniacidonis TaxID=340345 RepID=A0AAC9MZ38_9PSEU|nr:serine hydrolase domain-containing protein [Actinoalloteichus hymeniacidonis]AOS64064.1 penicillin-binding protein, beta-lactamase class C [Actinoalloteichus hymeniacidonis]MBB5907874.1 CubicO group peptidase (beta-lactamase class C family) [Actinoalloteichus hymeniacidonis]
MDLTQLPALVAYLAERHRVPGAQLVVRRGEELRTTEFGVETVGSRRAVVADSAFPLGSLTKPFTATLAMLLVADGDIDLDDTLPGLTLPGVTLRRVLAHTGGLVSSVTVDNVESGSRTRWLAVDRTANALANPPGTAFSYSNLGYLLIGHLIEEHTGMPWWEAVTDILLRPDGIRPAFVVGPADQRTDRNPITGHAVRASGGSPLPIADQPLPLVEEPAGALALSAADLVAFASAHLPGAHSPIGERTARWMREDQTEGLRVGPFGMADGWSLGWSIYSRGGHTWYGHDGTGGGTSCHLRFHPDSATAIGFTANANTGLAMWEELVEELRKAGLDVGSHSYSTLPDPGAPVPAPPECLGRYVNGDTEFVLDTAADGELRLCVGGAPYARLTCYDGLLFTMREIDGGGMVHTGRFVPGEDSETVVALQISGRLARRHG